MIFIDDMKNLKIYKTQMFLPTLDADKKKGSAILLLTPNQQSSIRLMKNSLFINKLRFASYYLEKDISYYIGSNKIEEVEESELMVGSDIITEANNYIYLESLSQEERDKIHKNEFGLPNERKYPLDSEKHVRSAIKFFNYCKEQEEEQLASNIIRAIKKFDMKVNVGSNNRFKKYYSEAFNESYEESLISADELINSLDESVMNLGDKIMFISEASIKTTNTKIRSLLFNQRLKKRDQVEVLYDTVKADVDFIRFTYHELKRYAGRNLFVDTYYYNKLFFENNNWTMQKGMNLFQVYLDRIINNPSINNAGYSKKTIFIPVLDWSKSVDVWNFKKELNPLSLIYNMMYKNQIADLKKLFGKMDVVFIGRDKYFKINFSTLDEESIKILSIKFKTFLIKLISGEEFDSSDIDTSADTKQSPKVIKANIVDKIEISKGVDLTKDIAKAQIQTGPEPEKAKKPVEVNKNTIDSNISKLKANDTVKSDNKKDVSIAKLAKAINNVADNSPTEDDALDQLDDDQIKAIIVSLDSDEDKPKMSDGRAARVTELDQKSSNIEIKGKSIKDILNEPNNDEPIVTNAPVDSPNKEWSNLTFMNFDKDYDLDKDIIRCFKSFANMSNPVVIRNMTVENTSTSEDRIETYTAEMEDYRGKRFTIKLDIPIMVDNRFYLRGNYIALQSQSFNMPIIKTAEDTCQLISNYMKVFIYRIGDNTVGKSNPITSKLIKAINNFNKFKVVAGNNKLVCSKYQLPIDYVDLASIYNTIETPNEIIYFNQDEIRGLYEIDDTLGIPYAYNKKEKTVSYYDFYSSSSQNYMFCEELLNRLNLITGFSELFDSAKSTSIGAYTRCSIMNSDIPLAVIAAYHVGLRDMLDRAGIYYTLVDKLTKEIRADYKKDYIKFKDGYIVFDNNYSSELLMNGLKLCPTEEFELSEIDNRNMYLEFLDNFGGRIKADGLDNFYDLFVDPITKDSLMFYKFPTDYISMLLYGNAMLADNKFIRHTDSSSRRLRRYILIAVYTYKVLADAYGKYSYDLRRSGRDSAQMLVKQYAVIDKLLADPISSPDSCINALRDVETTNSITTKGPSGMNSDRAYTLDKRTYDESMINVIGMSTGFAGNVGITRQATIDANVDKNGYFIDNGGRTDTMNSASTLTATEALTPFGTTHDDPFRTAMTFIQTAKHMVRTEDSDPLLVTNGSDEAMVYLSTNKFAYKAKGKGKVVEVTDEYIIVDYDDGTHDYVNLKETIEHNSDGGYYVPLKLDINKGIKVGTKVDETTVLAYDKYSFSNSLGESDNLAFNIGKLCKIAVLNSDEGFEDSGVITEKAAKKLATRIDYQFSATLDKDTDLLSICNIGDHVEAGGPLMMWRQAFDDEAANSLLKSLSGDEVSELGKKVLKSEVTGTVKDIKIYRTVEISDLSDSLKKFVNNYEKPIIELEKKLRENNIDISQLPPHTILPPTGKLKKAVDAIVVEIYVEYLDTVGIGDKVVYYSANKAVEKALIPEGKEPYTDFRPNEPIDAFVSGTSIDKRIVSSTLIIGGLQKLMIELDRSVKDIMGIPYDDSTV